MRWEAFILIAGWAAICAIWVGLLIAQIQTRRAGMLLTPLKPAGPPHAGETGTPPAAAGARAGESSVCVVIAARNEAPRIAACLRSVLAQDYAFLSVVVADDRSEDDTAAIVAALARRDPRLRLERINDLPAGWLGKSHALWRATRSIDSEWLLFLDADCTLEPSAVRTAVHHARHRNIDLLTLWPRLRAEGFWEHLTIPLCAGIIALWFHGSVRSGRRPRAVPGDRAPGEDLTDRAVPSRHDADSAVLRWMQRAAFGNGQFLLVRRDVYERIDGHRSVRRAIIEDIPLAEQAARAGARCWTASGRDLAAVRMYDAYRAIRDGWARIYVGALRSGTRIALGIVWLLAGSLLPFVAGALLAAAPASMFSPTVRRWFGTLCAAHLLLMLVVSYRFWGLGGCRRRYLVLYPLSVVVVVRILARAWWWLIVRRSVPWRDRRYAIDRRARIVAWESPAR